MLLQPCQEITERNLLENDSHQISFRFSGGKFAHRVSKTGSHRDFSEIFRSVMHVLWRNDRTAAVRAKESGKRNNNLSIIGVVYKKICCPGKLCTSTVMLLISVPPVTITMINSSLVHLFSLFVHFYWTSKTKFPY